MTDDDDDGDDGDDDDDDDHHHHHHDHDHHHHHDHDHHDHHHHQQHQQHQQHQHQHQHHHHHDDDHDDHDDNDEHDHDDHDDLDEEDDDDEAGDDDDEAEQEGDGDGDGDGDGGDEEEDDDDDDDDKYDNDNGSDIDNDDKDDNDNKSHDDVFVILLLLHCIILCCYYSRCYGYCSYSHDCDFGAGDGGGGGAAAGGGDETFFAISWVCSVAIKGSYSWLILMQVSICDAIVPRWFLCHTHFLAQSAGQLGRWHRSGQSNCCISGSFCSLSGKQSGRLTGTWYVAVCGCVSIHRIHEDSNSNISNLVLHTEYRLAPLLQDAVDEPWHWQPKTTWAIHTCTVWHLVFPHLPGEGC